VRSSNAATVLRTLVPQARAIFRLLAEHQMADEQDEFSEEGERRLTPPPRGRVVQHCNCVGAPLVFLVMNEVFMGWMSSALQAQSAAEYDYACTDCIASVSWKHLHSWCSVDASRRRLFWQLVLTRPPVGPQPDGKTACSAEGVCVLLPAGMTFVHLFRMSRERLLVANDTALRSHLTEFKDHDLLQTRCCSLEPESSCVFALLSRTSIGAQRSSDTL
jgi:hypothetical protein